MQLIAGRFRTRWGHEGGFTLVIMSAVLVGLMGSAAVVLDFALVRSDRQHNKSAADMAVAAGVRSFNFDGVVAPFHGACAAIDYLKSNHSSLSTLDLSTGWTFGGVAPVPGGNPCDPSSAAHLYYDTTCSVLSADFARSTFAWYQGTTPDGSIDISIKAGYSSSDMTTDGFRDDHYNQNSPSAANFGCDQLAVIVGQRQKTGFGSVLGVSETSSRVRSVGRVTIGADATSPIALLLLESNDCAALDINGSSTTLRVLGTGVAPGMAHADSYGNKNGGNCSSKEVLTGLHSNGIVAERAPMAPPDPPGSPRAPGVISTAAASGPPGNAAKAYDSLANVVAQDGAPTGHAPVGRIPVDYSYRVAVAALEAEAEARFEWSDITAIANGFHVAGCNPNAADLANAKLFIRCANFSNETTFPANVTEVVFTHLVGGTSGKISMGAHKTLKFVSPTKVYVYGDSSGGTPQGLSLGSNSTLSANLGPTSTSCTSRTATSPTATTKFVVGHGQLNMTGGGTLQLCSTTLLMADGSIPTVNGTPPDNNNYKGQLSMGGGANIDWTAPNTNPTNQPTPAQLYYFLEDLAFWTETSDQSNVNGSGSGMVLSGVFFAPNANPFAINAGSGSIVADAQFIVRYLSLSGGGQLSMRANPANVVLIPYVTGYRLVR